MGGLALSHALGMQGKNIVLLVINTFAARISAALTLAPGAQGNDIVLCDGGCSRAYHERCVVPRLVAAELSEDDGWLCPACDAKVRSLPCSPCLRQLF